VRVLCGAADGAADSDLSSLFRTLRFVAKFDLRLPALFHFLDRLRITEQGVVRMRGLEPPPSFEDQILSLARLPISPHPLVV
jgi:hypothetical protein